MGLYTRYLLPRVVDIACSTRSTMRQREKVIPCAHGRVLEVGVGSGLNFPYYDAGRVSKVWGLDPSPEMIRIAGARVSELDFAVELLTLPGEQVPLRDNSVDSVVVTYSLCTIADADRALQEMARVLKPGGELIFCEHGVAPDRSVRRWQKLLNPLWQRVGGGCQLNRDIPDLIGRNGFAINRLQTRYIPGWRPASYNYWGTATLPSKG